MSDDSLGSSASSFADENEKTGVSSDDGQSEEDKHKSWLPFSWSQDTRRVFFWMTVVLVMIGITAGIVLGFTFTFLSNEEENEFKNAVSYLFAHGMKVKTPYLSSRKLTFSCADVPVVPTTS